MKNKFFEFNKALLIFLLALIIIYLLLICHNLAQIIKHHKLELQIKETRIENYYQNLILSALKKQNEAQVVSGIITCYTSETGQCDGDPWLTASGYKLQKGDRVVANNCLPFGSRVVIGGITYTVQDRKNSRYGCEWFDIWFGSEEQTPECFAFGKQYKQVKVLTN